MMTKGTVTKQVLSIAQSIQYNINRISNQTTLDLAVKLHHSLGSREVVDTLHEYGYLCTFDEVLRFRKSVAKYVDDHPFSAMGIDASCGNISVWFDNFDLNISTPNGMRRLIPWLLNSHRTLQPTLNQFPLTNTHTATAQDGYEIGKTGALTMRIRYPLSWQ